MILDQESLGSVYTPSLGSEAGNSSFPYREGYLQKVVAELRARFETIGLDVPLVRCSCSFPHRGGPRVEGQCFFGSAISDGVTQIIISPLLDDAVEVAGVLVHELIHAALPHAGHRKPFRDAAIALGLEDPMRSTPLSPQLRAELAALTAKLGPYPHASLNPYGSRKEIPGLPRPADQPQRQKGRLLKVACPNCGYLVRVARMWLDRAGPPICPCGQPMREAAPQQSNVRRTYEPETQAR